MLASDLANLPQFLCRPDDIVLVAKRPSVEFLSAVKQAGFPLPEFVELKEGRINPASGLCQRKIGSLRPWAWGPDSLELLQPLLTKVTGEARTASQRFNDGIAGLYSKAWSAAFLRTVLARSRRDEGVSPNPSEHLKVGRAVPSAPGGAAQIHTIRTSPDARGALGTARPTSNRGLYRARGRRGGGHRRGRSRSDCCYSPAWPSPGRGQGGSRSGGPQRNSAVGIGGIGGTAAMAGPCAAGWPASGHRTLAGARVGFLRPVGNGAAQSQSLRLHRFDQ